MSELWTEKQRLIKPIALLAYYYFLMSGSLVSAHDIALFSLCIHCSGGLHQMQIFSCCASWQVIRKTLIRVCVDQLPHIYRDQIHLLISVGSKYENYM